MIVRFWNQILSVPGQSKSFWSANWTSVLATKNFSLSDTENIKPIWEREYARQAQKMEKTINAFCNCINF